MSLLLLTSGALAWSCNSTAEKQNDLQTMEFGLAGTSDMLYWGDTIPYYLDRTFLSSFPGYNTVLDNPDQTYDVMLLHQKLDKPYRAYWEIIDGTLYLCAIDRYGVVPTDTVNDWSRMETMIGTKFDHPASTPIYTDTRSGLLFRYTRQSPYGCNLGQRNILCETAILPDTKPCSGNQQ